MSTIDELRSILRGWTRGDRIGPAESYVEPILQSAIREIDRLTVENAKLREENAKLLLAAAEGTIQPLLEANRGLSAEAAELRVDCNFLKRDVKDLMASLEKSRAHGIALMAEISRLRAAKEETDGI
jgi:hypothetical protein